MISFENKNLGRVEPKIFENVGFTPITKRSGEIVGWQSSSTSRKAIELAKDQPEPEPGKRYRVEIIEDTNPGDVQKGKYIARFLETKDTGTGEWMKAEDKLDKAEKAQRRSLAASHELYKLSGVPKKIRAEKPVVVRLPRGQDRVAKKAMEREATFDKEVQDLLGGPDSLERTLADFRMQNLIEALRRARKLDTERKQLAAEEQEVIKTIEGEPSGPQQEVLADLRRDLAIVDVEREELMNSSPEAYYGLNLKELEGYKKALDAETLVETPYVRERALDIVTHLRAGKPVMIYGHLGSGKTELAMHVAKSYLGKEALILSGSKHTSLAELYGHQVLAIDRIDKGEMDGFLKEVESKYEAWLQEHPEADMQRKNQAHDRILQAYLAGLKSGTVSGFFLGPIYSAMEHGRPVIIDEVNAIPHEVLISLNHILTRRPGETINVQQDSGKAIRIKEGFGIIMTGNLNQGQDRYIDRQDMDPAFLSRLYKIDYDYLPQKTDGELSKEAGKENELFHLLLAMVMDKNGDIEAPKYSVHKLWRLAQAARVSQNVFAGRETSNAMFKQGQERPVVYFLKEAVLSIRALENIISQWQKEGYRYEIDRYIWTEFVSQSTSPADRAYLYQLFKDRFGFFKGKGWEQNPSYGTNGVVSTFSVKVQNNKPPETDFLGPRETVNTAFGKGPTRRNWPNTNRQPSENP